MPPIKKTTPVKQPAPPPPTSALTKWDEMLAREADIAAASTGASSGTFISLQSGVISVDKTPVPGNRLEAVILSHVFENAYYPGVYDPGNPKPPVCFAFGSNDDDMKIHELSSEPQGHPTPGDGSPGGRCATCWANQFGSADTGKGKACKNMRRIGLQAGDEEAIKDAESIKAEKVHYLKTPVMTNKFFDGYVKDCAKSLRRPPFALVTEIKSVPDTKSQFHLEFTVLAQIERADQFEALMEKKNKVAEEITFPYQPAKEDAAPTPARGRAAAPSKFNAKAPARPAARR